MLDKQINDALKEERPEEPKVMAIEAGPKLEELFKKIDNCNLTEESKLVFKKMIEYAKKYNAGQVKNYIPFNMRIYCDNDSTLYEITNILLDGFEYFKYTKSPSTGKEIDIAPHRSMMDKGTFDCWDLKLQRYGDKYYYQGAMHIRNVAKENITMSDRKYTNCNPPQILPYVNSYEPTIQNEWSEVNIPISLWGQIGSYPGKSLRPADT